MGINCNIIKPKEVAKLHPLVNIHDLVGALHLPEDAVVSPPDVNHALAVASAGQGNTNLQFGLVDHKSCVLLLLAHPIIVTSSFVLRFLFFPLSSPSGVQILERTSVQQVLVEKGCVTAVETDRGSIKCEYFVSCAGQVNRSIGDALIRLKL